MLLVSNYGMRPRTRQKKSGYRRVALWLLGGNRLTESVEIPAQDSRAAEPLPQSVWAECHLIAESQRGPRRSPEGLMTECGWLVYRTTPAGPRMLFTTEQVPYATCASCLQVALW